MKSNFLQIFGPVAVSHLFVKSQNKAVQKLFTRRFACEKGCENLFTYSRLHVLLDFLKRKVILNKFSCIKFPKKSKGGTGKEPNILYCFS